METWVFRNGAVYGDPSGGATAVAVENGTIAAVGDDDAVSAHLGRADEVVDLRGRLLMPGFVDAHIHPVPAGIERGRCDLTVSEDASDYRRIIHEYAVANLAAAWILGGGWSMSAFPGGRPHRAQLDAVVGDRPAFLPNRDHHSAWVSTAALRRAGIDRHTPDPLDGRIERDADGDPTGLLHEGAMALIERVVPADAQDDFDRGLRTAVDYLNSVGVVGWQDAMVHTDLTRPSAHAAYLRAESEGWLHARVSGALWWERSTTTEGVDAEVARLCELRDKTNAASAGRYAVHSVKIMQDGVAETYTAAMLEPYLDGCGCATDNSGISFLPPELLTQVVVALDGAGFQVHAHALGDRAVRDVLDAIAEARSQHGRRDNRHHLAHLQFVDPADVPRFRSLEVAANLQALWAAHEPQVDALTVPFLGSERSERMYPFGELHRADTTLVMGSDWPVSTADPLQAVHVAVNRVSPDAPAGAPPLGVRQELALSTALRAYTQGSAYINRRELSTGAVRVGALADLVVLDQNPFVVPPSDLASIRVDQTFVSGAQVYSSDR